MSVLGSDAKVNLGQQILQWTVADAVWKITQGSGAVMGARFWLTTGCCLGMLTVLLGAFGAHLIEDNVTEWYPDDFEKRLENWKTAVRYMAFHTAACLLVGIWQQRAHSKLANLAGFFFLTGIALFSGGLFGWIIVDQGWLVAIVPVGGLMFMIGWACLVAAVQTGPFRQSNSNQ